MKISSKIANYIKERKQAGKTVFLIYGGRRSTKTYSIMQYLLLRCYQSRTVVIVCGMTVPQLHEGCYQDAKNIIWSEPGFNGVFEICNSPMEIRCKLNGSRMVFSSFDNPEKAKGASCDIIYLNELNNFSYDQYINITCNAREAIFADWNPVSKFFIHDLFSEDEMCHMYWKDNPFLTQAQIAYFDKLKEQAERPDATQMDIYQYKVQYLGEYCGIDGEIFNRGNIHLVPVYPELHNITIFGDPSALRGADYFALCLGGLDCNTDLYVLDTYSINSGTPQMIVDKLYEWERNYDVKKCFIESNGIIGTVFLEQLQRDHRDLHPVYWFSRDSKFDRILSNYQNLTNHTFVLDTPQNNQFLQQVYDFSKKAEHDDNADALNSLWTSTHWH
ncbi:MAG: phage terminase large subunit [Clostridiales bacterium]|nr:phage terminase large subunit [Clostridiales bacterium]MBQ1573101.1 phage terminase large subunit [Clostridiales bacterium]